MGGNDVASGDARRFDWTLMLFPAPPLHCRWRSPHFRPRHPLVIELFQSQGCSSCPPANANLFTWADRDDALALNFSVDYWDSLGWKDTFAKPAFTARQWAYAQALAHSEVYTPQMIVNGRADVTGADAAELQALD